jgi:glycosyltransferase involved in cell wall biosynthesis
MAAGVPVIAYKEGGIVDTVTDGETGILFAHQTTQSLIGALQKAETSTFIKTALRNRAKRYDTTLFVTKIRHYVTSAYQRAR